MNADGIFGIPKFRFVPALALTALLTGCSEGPRAAETERILNVADIGIEAVFGANEYDDHLGVLRRPIHAIFSGDEVFVLDASPPWVRVYDRQGRFLRAMVRQGQGPGEAVLPYTLSATRDGGFVLTHSRGIDRFDAQGNAVFRVPPGDHWVRGAAETCEGEILALGRPPGEIDGRGLLLRAGPDNILRDTVALLHPLRSHAQLRRQASFLEAIEDGVSLYPEEVDRHRLIEVGCDGRLLREFELEPLGEPERTGPPPAGSPPGRFAVTAAQPPLPGGLSRIGGRVLWAALVTNPRTNGMVDSTTVITAFDADGSSRRLQLQGWYQLFQGDRESLLLGNADGMYPSVILVNGAALLRRIDDRSPRALTGAR
jgi:hypothetical protein